MRAGSMQAPGIANGATAKRAVRPTASARKAHHSSSDTASLPPQFSVVAGTDAAATSFGSIAAMSSSWIGL